VVDIEAEDGWVDHVVAREFPQLRMRYTVIDAGPVKSPIELQDRLLDISGRFRGQKAMQLPSKPIPSAYRVFLRQVGLDPESHPSPIEAVSRDRVLRGTFISRNRLLDALLIATIESQIAIAVVDADTIELPLGIRQVRADDITDLPVGTLVIADAERVVAELLGQPEPGHQVHLATTRTAVASIGVAGIADWMLDDALWRVADIAVTK
jgi:DNA/RNA-binding domain of Phe-tRNA-synthetase-like protein